MLHDSEVAVSLEELKSFKLKNYWLELREPSDSELEAVAEKTGIPQACFRTPEIAENVSFRSDSTYGVINFVVVSDVVKSREVYPITIAFTGDFLVTIEKAEYKGIIDLAKARMAKGKIDTPALMVHNILDEIVSNNFVHLEEIEARTTNLEEEILEKADGSAVKALFALKSRMISFNKILWYERGVVFNLRNNQSFMPAKVRSLFDSTHECLTRQVDIVETYREMITDASNLYLSKVSNLINTSIKALTVVIFYLTIITTITSFPNTFATIFGISQFGNTHNIIVFSVLILSTILPLLWLWKKKWLKPDSSAFT
ncbi:MAG TPA: CorA family divalent cation transporter [Candidatus Bathyarchaeia archaeon]